MVAQVKAYKSGQPQETENAYFDGLYLLFCSAERRMFLLTDPLFYQLMWRRKGKDLIDLRRNGVDVVSPWELKAFLEEHYTK